MKKYFETDAFLKLASIVIAVILWLYIIVVVDPAIEVDVRELPIQFVGQEQLESNGLSVVSESATTVNVRVKGSRKKMGRYDMKTIIAKVNMSDVSEAGRHKVPVEIIVPFENSGISSQNHYHVELLVEKTIEKELELEIITEGTLAEDYVQEELTATPKLVTIKGPESVVGKISKAGVPLDFDNVSEDIEQVLPIQLYDSEGRLLVAQDALMKRISQDITETKVTCDVLKVRSVKISPQFRVESEDDRELLSRGNYTVKPSTIQIYGEETAVAKVTEILTERISLNGLSGDTKMKVSLNIPKDVKVVDDISEVEIILNNDLESEKD